jgi:hypothetical protein
MAKLEKGMAQLERWGAKVRREMGGWLSKIDAMAVWLS